MKIRVGNIFENAPLEKIEKEIMEKLFRNIIIGHSIDCFDINNVIWFRVKEAVVYEKKTH